MRNGWIRAGAAALALTLGAPAWAQSDEAKRFGQRENVEQISISPDGTRVVYLSPGPGRSTVAYVASVGGGDAQRLTASSGDPEHLRECRWSSATRIVCQVVTQMLDSGMLVGYSRMIAIDADGKNLKVISAPTTSRALSVAQFGGDVIDWLPEGDGSSVLMTRVHVAEYTTGTHLANSLEGLGVDRVDTTSIKRSVAEQPNRNAMTFITDGHGTVRVMGTADDRGGYDTGMRRYFYRPAGDRDWKPLSTYDSKTDVGFVPLAVDRELNTAYGFETVEGRNALYRVALDGSLAKTQVFRHPQVDVDSLIRIGRQRRVVGVGWATEKREAQYFDPAVKSLTASLSKALPGLPLVQIIDASLDETRMLVWAGSDVDPGRYYVFDRKAKSLNLILLDRPALESAKLASVKPITFKATDGTEIPGYLTLPAGSDGKNLPAIVMPHGGPSARDEWGFDWLAQFFAARGYAVLQPNYRGSAGYGNAWYAKNGFKSWRTAIGDVNDGGRWLVSQGIAAPGKLAIVGWSYGGYAALQSSVLDPQLFKAIVAVAPVTDLGMTKAEADGFTNARLVRDFVGAGPHVEEGSPARNAASIAAPVLMFHGDRDANVGVAQSRTMESRLKGAGKRVELVVFPGLDHQLEDSTARTQMLDKADTFLRSALGM